MLAACRRAFYDGYKIDTAIWKKYNSYNIFLPSSEALKLMDRPGENILEKSNFRMEEPIRFGQDQFSNPLWYHSFVYAKPQLDP